jgi:glyoxalase family protein
MVHRLVWRVASDDALAFWVDRLTAEGVEVAHDRVARAIVFEDPEGLALEFAAIDTGDEPLTADAPDIPAEHRLLGFEGVRAYGRVGDGDAEDRLLTAGMGFERTSLGVYVMQGRRRATYTYDDPPAERGFQGAGTVHHIAWCDRDDEHEQWRDRVASFGQHPTPVIDRQYFLSIYYRVPSGVLFELATPSPGFAIDEDPAHLGEALRLPPQHEPMREHLEHTLTPLINPRAKAARS